MAKPPKYKDYRTTRDGVMVADVGFKRQLSALDPELDVVWDWGSEVWEIWRFPGQAKVKKKRMDHRAFYMATVSVGKRTFRELGADILLKLQMGDPRRYSLKELCDYFDAMDDNIQRAKTKKFMDDMEDLENSVKKWWTVISQQVPRAFRKIKPSEERLLIQVPPKELGTGPRVFKVPKNLKITNAIAKGGIV